MAHRTSAPAPDEASPAKGDVPPSASAPGAAEGPVVRSGELGVGRSLVRFTLRVAVGTVLAVAVYLALARKVERGADPVSLRIPTRSPAIELPASSPAGGRPSSVEGEAGTTGRNAETPSPAPSGSETSASPTAVSNRLGALATEIEARHGRGELSDMQRRLRDCPDGDVRRVAWVDEAQRVRKLTRERAGGVNVEEWFDEAGELREARIRVAPERGAAWVRHVTVGPDGRETSADSGAAPPLAGRLPALVHGDATAALFAPPTCAAR